MGPIEIIVIVVTAAILLSVIGFAVWRKVKGKSGGCGCGCSNCSGCTHAKKKRAKNQHNR